MTPEKWREMRPILEGALELAPALRAEFLDRVCEDAAMRLEIEALIHSHEHGSTEVLDSTEIPSLSALETRFSPRTGKRIGAYEIIGEIAQGGMGAVYRAVRADGQYQQQVALKIVRADLSTPLAAGRFRNERQILASLDHPNIAKILDGGSTTEDLPYFVMEFIDGRPLTEYCDLHKLSIPARLALFRSVCSAVHYAHQHLVIHRDIKPSNILVTADGIPKLLDFGIAKIFEPGLLPENSTLTVGGQWLMTPEYASPEQLRGDSITTATDIYSLGLVLYQLLAGHHAYHFQSRIPHEIARTVLESDPEKPSTAIRRKEEPAAGSLKKSPLTPEMISGLRADSSEKLQRRLSGDLDNIVLKAIQKAPADRYSSADQLSEDLRRHLEGLPVLARKATIAYRVRKYVLRNKVGVTAAALIVGCVVMAMFLIVREARIARANELRAERHFNNLRALAGSLIFEVHDSIAGLQGSVAARKLILERAQQYLDSLAAESENDPDFLRELAAAYSKLASVEGDPRDASLGVRSKAEANYRKALALRQAALRLRPGDKELTRELAWDQMNLAVTQTDEKDKAGPLREALLILEPLAAANPQDQRTLASLAKAYELKAGSLVGQSDLNPSLTYYEQSLGIRERLAKSDPKNEGYQVELSFAHKHVGSVLAEQGRLDEALDHYHQALAIDEAQLSAHPDNSNTRYFITYTYSDLGYILGKRGNLDEALSSYRKALDIRAAMVAADPHDARARGGLANTYGYMGLLRQRKGDFAGARDFLQKSLSLREELAKAAPTDEVMRFKVAESESLLGKLYAAAAAGKHIPRQQQINDCREAVRWIGLALPAYEHLAEEGKLGTADAGTITEMREAMQKCGATESRRVR